MITYLKHVRGKNDSDLKHRKCLRIVTFDSTIDSEIMETKSFVSKMHKVSSPDGDYIVQYSEITPEGIELILWGDLKIMTESSTEENDQGDFWNNQQDWGLLVRDCIKLVEFAY
ncbi:hypothetical protein Tco_0245135 [Tanacetum coccineum]